MGPVLNVEGVACHALDWDDYTHPMHGHAASVLLPVAWHVSRSLGGGDAELARADVKAAPDWLLGQHGMRDVLAGELCDAEAASAVGDFASTGIHALETSWGLAQKPYACRGSCHAGLDALISLVVEHDLAAGDIDVLELHTDPLVPQVMTRGEPVDPYAARYCLRTATRGASCCGSGTAVRSTAPSAMPRGTRGTRCRSRPAPPRFGSRSRSPVTELPVHSPRQTGTYLAL